MTLDLPRVPCGMVSKHRFSLCEQTLHQDLDIDLGQKCGDSSPVVSRRRQEKVKARKISPKVLKITKPSFFYNDFYDKCKEIIAVSFFFLDK